MGNNRPNRQHIAAQQSDLLQETALISENRDITHSARAGSARTPSEDLPREARVLWIIETKLWVRLEAVCLTQANAGKEGNSSERSLTPACERQQRMDPTYCRLVLRHPMDSMTKTSLTSHQLIRLDNKANIRHDLQTSLDYRSKYQLDSILKQLDDDQFGTTRCELGSTQWNTSAFETQGVKIEFNETTILPINAAFIKNAVQRWPSLGSSKHEQTHDIWHDEHAQSISSGGEDSDFDRVSIMKRLFQVNGSTVVFWGDAPAMEIILAIRVPNSRCEEEVGPWYLHLKSTKIIWAQFESTDSSWSALQTESV